MIRTGIGFDVHRLAPGRKLFLGGVLFEDADVGLEGHSDADVVCHAVCDALLGALAMGDIGEHFPDTDPAFLGMASVKFLEKAREMIAQRGYRISNIDCTVMTDVIRLGDKKKRMTETIASHLGIHSAAVSVKATTWEGRGAVGRGEVIACQAVATLYEEK